MTVAEAPDDRDGGGDSRGDDHDTAQDERLDGLERAEARRAEGLRLDRRFELTEAIILSLAAILAAWAGFQATTWGGVETEAYSEANAARLESVRAAERADQEQTVDVLLFAEWLSALEAEGLVDQSPVEGQPYVPDPDQLSGFLYERFRDEFQPAVQAWVAQQPRINESAPPTPFVMEEYRLASAEEAAEREAEAEARTAEARSANSRADRYVLMTILCATVLFFAGISSKLDTARARGFLLGAAVVLLTSATVLVALLPRSL